jgi:poly(beta-D-mannuronate) lyase
VKKLQPGDTLRLANGVWSDFEIVFTGKGTAEKPITLTAEEKGKVIISGRSNLRLAGEHLVVSGLVFKNGHTPTSEVISFRRNSDTLAFNSRVTEVVIDGFNNPERTETDSWVMMYGRNNRFDHNHLVGKNNNGVTMAVRLNSEDSQKNYHRIDHNYFGPRPILGSNGGETLRIGTSQYSLTNSFTLVENNFFERCDGEVEIISSKSGGNIFRGNVFLESRGTLTLRHGNDNRVENNVFIGNGVDHTGGIRVINKRQVVQNNYMQGLAGYRFGSALVVMNGVPDSPINRYHQVENSLIQNNSIIDSDHIELAAGSDAERSAVPITTKFQNNLVYNADGSNVFTVHDDVSGITFAGNVLNQVVEFPIKQGFSSQPVALQKSASGLMLPTDPALQNVGVSADLKVLQREETGVSWYPKPDQQARFDTGKVINVEPGEDALEQAVAKAGSGDIIELQAGNYLASKLLLIDTPLTFRAASPSASPRPLLEFERNALFEIADGGSLKLDGLEFSGEKSPDNAGNTLIRTSRYSMLNAYQLVVENCEIKKLNINHSFNFLSVSRSTFADRIEIRNSKFLDITGAVLELDKETDDLGLYNAEYVSISDSSFENIGEAVAILYRGGTDESTFGPHFELRESTLNNVGNNNRNKSGNSVLLHGVQVATLSENEWQASKPVRVSITVGDPVTTINDNQFKATAAPVIENGTVNAFENEVSE